MTLLSQTYLTFFLNFFSYNITQIYIIGGYSSTLELVETSKLVEIGVVACSRTCYATNLIEF